MGSLQTPTNLSNNSCSWVSGRGVQGLSVLRQMGFSCLLKGRKSRKIQSLCVTCSFSGGAQDGSSIAENKKVSDVFLLGPERDGSGSVVGFQLIPHSGTALFVFLNFTVPFSTCLFLCMMCFSSFYSLKIA